MIQSTQKKIVKQLDDSAIQKYGIRCQIHDTKNEYPLHCHRYFEFEYLKEGKLAHELNGTNSILIARDCFCLNHRDMHKFTVLEPIIIYNLAVNLKQAPEAIRQFLNMVDFPRTGHIDSTEAQLVEETFLQIQGLIQTVQPYAKEKLTGYLLVLLTKIFENTHTVKRCTESEGYVHISQALKYINLHFNEELSLKQVAENIYLSPNYLSSLFSKYVGTTFLQYIIILRIDYSKNLLATTNDPIVKISSDCGFCSCSSFYRAFKKLCDCSPNEYRTNMRYDAL